MARVTRFVPVVLAAALLAGSFTVMAAEKKGSEKMSLDGGSRGLVPFPHRVHQEKLPDCGACHDVFPQEAGVIVRFKSEGRLAGKQVMNKLCISCHRSFSKEGAKTGPLTCSECHLKS